MPLGDWGGGGGGGNQENMGQEWYERWEKKGLEAGCPRLRKPREIEKNVTFHNTLLIFAIKIA